MTSTRLNRHTRWCVVSLSLVLCSMGPPAAAGARKPATHTVTIDASRYEPEQLTVQVGDTVVWVNKDLVAHTATSQMGDFDSGLIAPGKSWKYRSKRAGEFAYTCTYHPTMKATLRVK
jgi:plastocyanin